MTDIAQLGLEVRSDGVVVASKRLQELIRDGKQAEASANTLSTSFDKMSKYASAAAVALQGMALYAFTKQAIDAALAMERLNKMFSAAAGNAQLAAAELQYIKNLSDKMGLSFASTAESYAKFMIAIKGTVVEGEKGRKTFEGISAAMTALGKTPEEAGRVFAQIQQGFNKGKVQLEDINIIAEAGVPIWGMMEKAIGKSKAEIAKLMGDSKLLAEDVYPKVAEQMEKTFGAAAVDGANSAQAAINRMNNAMMESKATAGSALMPVFTDLVKFVLTPMARLIGEIVKGLQGMAAAGALAYNELKSKLGGVISGKAFSASGRADINAESAENNAIYEAAMARINAGPTATAYTAAQLAAQAKNKASTLADSSKKEKKNYTVSGPMTEIEMLKIESEYIAKLQKQQEEAAHQRYQDAKEEYELSQQWRKNDLEAFLKGNEAEKQGYEDIEKARKKAYDESLVGGMTNAIEEYGKAAANVGEQIKQTFLTAFKNMEDAIVNFVQTGKLNFKSLFMSIQADLIRITVAKPITSAVAGGLNTGAMGSFLSGNAATATGAATSGLFGAGGKMSFGGGLAFGGIVAGLGMVANGLFDLDGSSAAAAEALKRLRVQMKEFENDMQVRVMRSQGDIKAADLKAFTDKQAAERQQYADDLKKINLEWMYTNAGRTISTRANETNIQKNKELLSELDKQQAILLEAFKKNQEAGNIALQMREAELSQGKESAAYLKLLNYQRELELLNMDKADQAIQKRIWALEDEKTAIESTNKSISKTVDVALSAVNAIRDIQGGSLSIDSPEERYRKAKQAWLSATPDKAGEYGKAFLTASQGYNASGAGYQADYASVMGKLQSYAGMTGSTTAEQQLTVLGEIRDAVQDNKELKVQNKILLALLNVSQNIAETSSVTSGAATTTAQKASLKAAA